MMLFLLILIFSLLSIIPLKAIEEFTLVSGQKYFGFVIEDNKDDLSIIDQFNTKIKIKKQSITIQKRIFTEVVTRFGAKYTAHLKTIEDEFLMFTDEKGNEIRIPRSDLDYIMLDNTKLTNTNWRVLSSKILSLPNGNKTNYSSFGFTLGTPGVWNVNYIKNYSDGWGLKLTGGISPVDVGLQTNVLYNLDKTRALDANLFIGAGCVLNYEYNYSDNYIFVGTGFDINFYGLYLELGISANNSENHSKFPQIIGALGYIYRFND